MQRYVALLTFLLAACGGGDSNAPSTAFACLGQALPTTAPSSIAVTGQVEANALNPSALSGAIVSAFRTGDTTTLSTDTSDAGGLFGVSVTTGGTPVDGYLRVTEGSHIATYAYPARPLAANAVNNVLMITSSEFTFLSFATTVTQNGGSGFIGVVVKDCDGKTLAGASVTTNPASGAVRYNAGTSPSSSATSTSADGVAYLFNVPAGDVTVQASAGGHALRSHVVNARADVITLTEIQP